MDGALLKALWRVDRGGGDRAWLRMVGVVTVWGTG